MVDCQSVSLPLLATEAVLLFSGSSLLGMLFVALEL
jgi:hypothetical protein